MKKVGFTICAANYLSKALVLEYTFKKHNPNNDFIIYLVGDKFDISGVVKSSKVDIRFVTDNEIDDLNHFAFKFDVIEFSTFIKPKLMALLLEKYEIAYYIDPDIMFFSSLSVLESLFVNSFGLLTPHCFTPIDDQKKPSDLDFLRFGSYNLGFIGLKRCDLSFSFLNWWSDRLAKYGFYDPQSGMAVDQKWLDLGSIYFNGFKVVDHFGCNLAFWNLHERTISVIQNNFYVNGKTPLIFVHFSSYDTSNVKSVADKQDRFLMGSRPDFELISCEYKKLLVQLDSGLNDMPYTYDYFDDGGRIPSVLRRIYANHEIFFKTTDQFSISSKIYLFAKKNKLIAKGEFRRKNFKTVNAFPKFQGIVIFIFKIILRVLGPDKYFMLMRYLAFISSIHNQKKMFKVNE